MKKIAAIILAVVVLAACTRTPEAVSLGSEVITISASAPVLKGTLDGDQFYSWNPDDRILVEVIAGSSKQYVEFTTSEGGASALFTGTIPSGSSVGNSAYYPADAFTIHNGITATISQTYHGSLKNVPVPMVGSRWGSDAFIFRAAAGALKISYNNVPTDFGNSGSVVFQATEATSGSYTFDPETEKLVWDASKYASRGSFSDGSKITVSVEVSMGRSIIAYVPLPENSNWGKMKVSLLTETGQTFSENEVPQGTLVPIEAGRISRLPIIPFPAEIYLAFNPNDGDFSIWNSVPNANDPPKEPWTWRGSWDGRYVYATSEDNVPCKQVKFYSDEKYLYGYIYVDKRLEKPVASASDFNVNTSLNSFYVMIDNDDITGSSDNKQSFGSNNLGTGTVPRYYGYNVMLYGAACKNGVPGEWHPDFYNCTAAAGAVDTNIRGTKQEDIADAGYGGGSAEGDIVQWEFIIDKAKVGLLGRTHTNILVSFCDGPSSNNTMMPSIHGYEIDL